MTTLRNLGSKWLELNRRLETRCARFFCARSQNEVLERRIPALPSGIPGPRMASAPSGILDRHYRPCSHRRRLARRQARWCTPSLSAHVDRRPHTNAGRAQEHGGGHGIWTKTDGTPAGTSMWHNVLHNRSPTFSAPSGPSSIAEACESLSLSPVVVRDPSQSLDTNWMWRWVAHVWTWIRSESSCCSFHIASVCAFGLVDSDSVLFYLTLRKRTMAYFRNVLSSTKPSSVQMNGQW